MDEQLKQTYQKIAKFDSLNPMQAAVGNYILQNGDLGICLLLKSLTGTGKTEAPAIPALSMERRLIMVYPTRSLVEDQISRFSNYLRNWSAARLGKTMTLTVDTGAVSRRYQWRDGKTCTVGGGRTTRHLYAGDVIITTLDKFLYRFFGFGEPQKSYIYPLRIRYMNPIICFDEAHIYEEVAFTNFERLIRTLCEKGKDVVLMTATMPSELECQFDYLDTIDFVSDAENKRTLVEWQLERRTADHYPGKRLRYLPESITPEEDEPTSGMVERIMSEVASHIDPARRLIVTVETVKDAAYIYQSLRTSDATTSAMFSYEGTPIFLYHGRLTAKQRSWVYQELKNKDDNGYGYLLISTSSIEVGCDLNAHTLITQLCDPDRLIQRAGRCNRRLEMSDAQIIVVGDDIPFWATAFSEAVAEDIEQRKGYIEALAKQHDAMLDADVLLTFSQKRLGRDRRVEMMFDMLYEYVYEAKLENRKLHENGLIITRSWEPSITVCTGETDQNGLENPLDVPISRCITPEGEEPLSLSLGYGGVYKRVYDPKTHKPTLEMIKSKRWENGYNNNLIIQLPYDFEFDERLGYVEIPNIFNKSYPSQGKRFMKRATDGDEIIVWYIDQAKWTDTVLNAFNDWPKEDDETSDEVAA